MRGMDLMASHRECWENSWKCIVIVLADNESDMDGGGKKLRFPKCILEAELTGLVDGLGIVDKERAVLSDPRFMA